jgi:hypothetical protein
LRPLTTAVAVVFGCFEWKRRLRPGFRRQCGIRGTETARNRGCAIATTVLTGVVTLADGVVTLTDDETPFG